MSWVARKIAGLDNEDQKAIIQQYFINKQIHKKLEEQEIKKFWEEYEDEYFTGGDNNG